MGDPDETITINGNNQKAQMGTKVQDGKNRKKPQYQKPKIK